MVNPGTVVTAALKGLSDEAAPKHALSAAVIDAPARPASFAHGPVVIVRSFRQLSRTLLLTSLIPVTSVVCVQIGANGRAFAPLSTQSTGLTASAGHKASSVPVVKASVTSTTGSIPRQTLGVKRLSHVCVIITIVLRGSPIQVDRNHRRPCSYNERGVRAVVI